MSDADSAMHKLPEHWAVASLGEYLINFDRVRVPLKAADRKKRQGSFDYYGASGVIDAIDDYLFDGEYLLLGEDGANLLSRTKAVAFRASGRFWVNNHAHVFQTHDGCSLAFIEHYLNSIDLAPYITGTAQPKLPQAAMNKIRLRVAPVAEQARIVGFLETQLSRLDAAVAGLKRVQANLKRYRASVLKAAVEGRLVPTEAELAKAQGRSYEPAAELLARILKERRKRWEDAELASMKAKGKPPKDNRWKTKYQEPTAPDTKGLPELPEGWCWATWHQIGFSQNGRPFPSAQYQDTGLRLLRPGNLHISGRVEWTERNTRCLPESWGEEFPGSIVGGGELVMNLTAQSLNDDFLGRVCMTGVQEVCLLNQRIARLSPILVRPRYALWLFKSSWFRRFVTGLNTGSLIQHMFTSQLADFCVPLPPLAEQDRIVAAVEDFFSVGEHIDGTLASSSKRTLGLRQSILKWAFEGKLVDQDPSDEPASALLQRIRAEREAAAATSQPQKRSAPKPQRKSPAAPAPKPSASKTSRRPTA